MEKEQEKKEGISHNRILPWFALTIGASLLLAGLFTQVDFTKKNKNTVSINDRPVLVHESAPKFELTIDSEDPTAISGTEQFHLVSSIKQNKEQIRNQLEFTPAISYTIQEESSTEFTIIPDEELESGSLLQAVVRTGEIVEDEKQKKIESWAFQVEEEFGIESTIPARRATRVPVDTGIEITFNSPSTDVIEGVEEAFTVTPHIDGSTEWHGNTFVFVPYNELDYSTVYTIDFNGDIHNTSSGEVAITSSFEFETERITDRYRDREAGIYSIRQLTNETSTQDPAFFHIAGKDLDQVGEVSMRVYSMNSEQYSDVFDDAISFSSWSNESPWNIDTAALELYADEIIGFQNVEYYRSIVEAPGTFDAGYYYVEFDGAYDRTYGSLLQVSDINAYVTVSETDTLVWVHDSITSQPIEGAAVTSNDGTILGNTNGEGLLQISTPNEFFEFEDANSIEITLGDEALRIPLSGNIQGNTINSSSRTDRIEKFWSYVYVDQPFYQVNDSLRYWGVLEPRNGQQIEKPTVAIRSTSWSNAVPYIEQDINFNSDTTFDGEISLQGLSAGYYYLHIIHDDKTITTKSFQILEQQKPAYTIDVSPQNIAVIEGDTYTHTIDAHFFDGTPVTFEELQIRDSVITTNENGIAEYSHIYKCHQEYTSCTSSVYVSPNQGVEGNVSGSSQVRVFASSLTTDTSLSHASDTDIQIDGTVYTVDIDGYNVGEYDIYEQPYGPVHSNANMNVLVTRKWSTKEQYDTAYDYIQKKTIPKYQYTRHSEEIYSTSVTSDESGSYSVVAPITHTDSSYEVTITVTDDQGRSEKKTRYISGKQYQQKLQSRNIYLSFDAAENHGSVNEFNIGETVSTQMYFGDEIPNAENQEFLYIQAQEGIRTAEISEDTSYSFTFEEQHIPSVSLQGVWFDGRSYWPTSIDSGYFGWLRGIIAKYNEENHLLSIETTADKEEYQPGDTVTLDIQAKRPDGTAAETELNINIIDEAIYNLLPSRGFGYETNHQVNFNTVLYRSVVNGIYSDYASHQYPLQLDGVEGGGGGPDRTDFPNKALFKSITTDKLGYAQVTFTIPDTITSWRVNIHGIDEERYAGNNYSSIVVSKDFFLKTTIADTYLTTDVPQIAVRAYGSNVDAESVTDIAITSSSLGIDTTTQVIGNNPAYIEIAHGIEGIHDITISASVDGEVQDTIVKQVEFIDSYYQTSIVDIVDASAGKRIQNTTSSGMEVTIADKYRTTMYNRLQQYCCNIGDRVDQRAARAISQQLLRDYWNTNITPDAINVETYIDSETGGITLFPYSESNLGLSALLVSSRIGQDFNRASLLRYFENAYQESEIESLDRVQALLGLAAFHQPVFADAVALMGIELTPQQQLYLAATFIELGAYEQAAEIYQPLYDEFHVETGTVISLELTENRHENTEYTGIAAWIAAALQYSEADPLLSYVINEYSTEQTLDLLIAHIIDTQLSLLPEVVAELTYSIDSEQTFVDVSNNQQHVAYLYPGQELLVTEVSGDIQLTSNAQQEIPNDELQTSDEMTITRSYGRTTFGEEELVTVRLIAEGNVTSLPSGLQYYQIVDTIPAGMKLVTSIRDHQDYDRTDDTRYPYHQDGNKVWFSVRGNSEEVIQYYLRPVSRGTYTVEAPVIQSFADSSLRNSGEDTTITIE